MRARDILKSTCSDRNKVPGPFLVTTTMVPYGIYWVQSTCLRCNVGVRYIGSFDLGASANVTHIFTVHSGSLRAAFLDTTTLPHHYYSVLLLQ